MRCFRSLAGPLICFLIFCSPCSPTIANSFADDAVYFGKVVRSIHYDADTPIDPSHYDPYLGIRPGDVLTRTTLKAAIQSLYDTGRFSNIVVDAVLEEGGVILHFKLRLNYYFNEFSVEGKVDLNGRSPSEVMSLPVGERFTSDKLEEARQTMLKYMHDRGFFLASVQARTKPVESNRQVNTTFEVESGKLATIASIEVRGVPPADAPKILDILDLAKGKKYDREHVRRQMESLKKHFLKRGFLGAAATLPPEVFDSSTNTVRVAVEVSNYGLVRVSVDGFKIAKDRLRRLLPVLSEGVQDELLKEGETNLRNFLEESGYPEAEIAIEDARDKQGVRIVTYKIDEGRKVTVSDVGFQGNESFSTETLLAAVQIQPARFLQKSVYSVQKLDADVEALRALYESAGYLNAEIIPVIVPVKGAERLRITFEVEEGSLARTRDLVFVGNTSLTSAALQLKMGLAPSGPYSPHLVERDRQAILAAYNDAGFLQPRVIYRVSDPDAANSYLVEFQITEGKKSFVDEIILLGNKRTRESVIKKRIGLKENDPLSLGRMLETQQSLYNLGVFDRVRVTPQNQESVAAYQDVVVRLDEAKQITVGYGLGYHERERLRGTLELRHLNILGTARRADLRLRGSRLEQGVLLSFQQPQIRFLPLDSYFTFSARVKKEVSFEAKRVNASYQFGQPLSNHSWGLLRYNFKNVRVSDLKVNLSDLEREDTPRNLSTVSASYVNDTRDDYLDAQKGFFTSTDLSLTTRALGSSNNFVSFYTQNHYYRKLPAGLLFSASVSFGTAHPFRGDTIIPISERFFAGGGSSLRGFEIDHAGPLALSKPDPNLPDKITYNPVGGNALLIANGEVRVPLLSRLHFAVFYDTGNVFLNLRDIAFSKFSHASGFGLRIKTPFGPLRVDYGFNLKNSNCVFYAPGTDCVPASLRDVGFRSRHLHVNIGPAF
jgi:outer membrane protein assembly complex protein YaeT